MVSTPSDAPRVPESPQCSYADISTLLGAITPSCGNSATPDFNRTATFGDYDLLEEIGRGGMGVIFRARQRSLNRIVALKMILGNRLASQEAVQRFYSEAETAAQLQHRGIVQIFEAGQYQGQHYFSMEYVDGLNLGTLMSGEELPAPTAAAEIVRRVAEAVGYAHERGVIHRDLKPANILLARCATKLGVLASAAGTSASYEPKVADFGLAKRTEVDSGMTGTGQILGTPSYMPPEQASGRTAEVGALADVYSLGAVLYALLTGRPPFRAASVMETLQQVIGQEPAPPRQLNPAIPKDLETICMKCLRKSSSERYASAPAFAEDLRRFLADEPITARPVSNWERASKWTRRRPVTAALAVVGLLTVMAVAGLVVSLSYQRGQERFLYTRGVLLAHEAWRDTEHARQLLKECPPHLRGWEWNYVSRLCGDESVTTIKPPRSSGGGQVASGGSPPLVVWDATSGHVITVLEEPTTQVIGVQFSPDGQQLETASLSLSRLGARWEQNRAIGHQLQTDNAESTVRLWNLETGRVIHTRTGQAGFLPRIAYSRDGSQVACQLSPVFNADRFPTVKSLSNAMASDSSEDTIQTRNAEKLRNAVLKGHSNIVFTVALSPDRLRLASAGNNGSIKLWDVIDCCEIRDFEGHVGPVYDVAFSSPDGHRLASAGNDRTVRIWDALTGRCILTLDGPDGHTRAVNGVAFHPDGGQVASASADLVVKIWNIGSSSETTILPGHTGPVQSIAFRPGGTLLASAGDDGLIKLWKPDTRKLVREIPAHDEPILALAFSPDGRLLASASHDRTVKMWNVSLGEESPDKILKGHKGVVYGVSFSPDRRHLASVGHDGNCVIWNIETGEVDAEFHQGGGPVFSTIFDPRGSFIAMGGYDLAVRNLKDGRENPLTNEGEVLSVAFSPDGSRLVSGSRDGTVRVWHVAKRRMIATLTGHLAPVTSVVFSPGGDRIASASWDESVKVWDPESQQEMLSLKGEGGRAYGVAFSPDGRYLASANHDGTITLWGR